MYLATNWPLCSVPNEILIRLTRFRYRNHDALIRLSPVVIQKLTIIEFPMLGADCPQLSAPAHGKIEGYRREVDSTVLLSCDQGYDIYPESSSFRTCQSNKQWSGANPICKGKKMLLPQTHISYLKHRLLAVITLLITWHLLSRPISPQLRFMID